MSITDTNFLFNDSIIPFCCSTSTNRRKSEVMDNQEFQDKLKTVSNLALNELARRFPQFPKPDIENLDEVKEFLRKIKESDDS